MKRYSIKTLADVVRAKPIWLGGDIFFSRICTDSRAVRQGDCFFAIKGENFDGHEYLAEVFDKGAVCAVLSDDISAEQFAKSAILKVPDTIQALGDFAAYYRSDCGFKVVGITGSVGKTTTRQIIYQVLSRQFRVVQSPKSFNNNIGVPSTIFSAEPEDQIIISEIGSNHPGEIECLTKIAGPDIAVITTVQPAHLEGFGDVESIAKEKVSIAKGLKKDGVLLINADCPILVKTCKSQKLKFKTFGISNHADITATNITYERFASRLVINGKEVFLPLPGPGNVENTLAAWSVCDSLRVSIEDFAAAVKEIKPVSMRTELHEFGSITVLSDCYNANPASMKNALEILANFGKGTKRRHVFICGDMAELGDSSIELHKELGVFAAGANVGLFIAVGKLAKIAADSAKAAAKYEMQAEYYGNTDFACETLKKLVNKTDIILVKGSRASKLEKIVEKLREIFT